MKRSGAPRPGRRCRAGRPGPPCRPRSGAGPAAVLVEQRLDQRRLAGAARAGQQHVVGGQPATNWRVLCSTCSLLRVDAARSDERDRVHVRAPAAASLRALPACCGARRAPAERDARIPVGLRRRRRQQSPRRARAAIRPQRLAHSAVARLTRSGPVVGVDAHVSCDRSQVHTVARASPRPSTDAHRDLALLHHALAVLLAVGRSRAARARRRSTSSRYRSSLVGSRSATPA